MKNTQIINEIDLIMQKYCDGCFVRTQLRKDKGKTIAHQFCIHSCTVGEEIKQKGEKLQ
ncbi:MULTISPECIES: zinc-finger domain-containing protein [unclassified Psychrobacillus]|uniref:zinc-finger domain-containing protein n=1 Tax=unclassified Psychrobacillus TaxID=2636677 RepID=UPI0024991552|nr:zinc-finger domain-containing protein [Psychrobacillus sp. NEAU-3TGS]MDI2589022.1 zinc-finger domain-containing protein [Psychrobacillus sp. NEAU-3TGS]